MAETWVIVEHRDGRRYSVRSSDARAKGKDGWTVEGEETPAAFVTTGVPKPKRARKRPAAKDAAPIAAPPADESEVEG